jgi:hypothetical protein
MLMLCAKKGRKHVPYRTVYKECRCISANGQNGLNLQTIGFSLN